MADKNLIQQKTLTTNEELHKLAAYAETHWTMKLIVSILFALIRAFPKSYFRCHSIAESAC